jgi:predicted RecA/RadA family phage recombinase
MKTYKGKGNVITAAAETDIVSGGVVIVGSLIGIATNDADTGESVAVSIEGIYEVPKEAGLAVDQGDKLFWHEGNGVATTTDTGVFLGHAALEAFAQESGVYARISPVGIEAGSTDVSALAGQGLQYDYGKLNLGGTIEDNREIVFNPNTSLYLRDDQYLLDVFFDMESTNASIYLGVYDIAWNRASSIGVNSVGALISAQNSRINAQFTQASMSYTEFGEESDITVARAGVFIDSKNEVHINSLEGQIYINDNGVNTSFLELLNVGAKLSSTDKILLWGQAGIVIRTFGQPLEILGASNIASVVPTTGTVAAPSSYIGNPSDWLGRPAEWLTITTGTGVKYIPCYS